MPACIADDGKYCCNSCTSHCKHILQLHYKICFKSFKNTSIYFNYLDLFTVSYLEIFKGSSVKLTAKERFKISFFCMQNKMFFHPSQAHGRGFGGSAPTCKSF